jgi:non-canonical (house-cleaning) NTP pyrophosphatase
MKISVGTTNIQKLNAVSTVITEMNISASFKVSGFKADSGVSETPLDEQTVLGALHRAKSVRNAHSNQDIYIGIESGLVSRYGDMYEEVWAVVIYGKIVCAAYSSGIKLPHTVFDHMNGNIQSHPTVMDSLREAHDIKNHDETNCDTWGDYTGNVIGRETGLKEAVRNALVQIFPGEKSFY